MGRANSREYRVWDATEEEALKAGVRKHGLGAWERIRTDPDFDILGNRTGVQLKDKWRNLVKFRHITPDETLELQPKTSGPWHRKYTATAAAAQRLAATGTAALAAPSTDDGGTAGSCEKPSAAAAPAAARRPAATTGRSHQQQRQQQSDTDEDADVAQDIGEVPMPKRKSTRSVKRRTFQELELEQDDDDSWEIGCDSESHGVGSRKRHRQDVYLDGQLGPAEDRRFGIYDRRRYGSGPGRDKPRQQSKPAGDSAADAAHVQPLGQRLEPHSGSGAAVVDDSYVVECACGIKYDDGNLMIECERCKAWAHVACLQAQMQQDPITHCYNFLNYICQPCQLQQYNEKQQLLQPLGRKSRSKQQRSLSLGAEQLHSTDAAAEAAAATARVAASAAAAAAAEAVQLQGHGLSGLLELLGSHHPAASAAAGGNGDVGRQHQQMPAAGLSGLPAALLGQGQGRLTPNSGLVTPTHPGFTHPLLQHSWLLQEAAAAVADGSVTAAAVSGEEGNHSGQGTMHSLHGAGDSVAVSPSAEEVAHHQAVSSSRIAAALAAGLGLLNATAAQDAAAAETDPVWSSGRQLASSCAASDWPGPSNLLQAQQQQQHMTSDTPAAREAAAAAGGGDPAPGGMVEIDPVLLLYLQGSLQVHKRQRGPAVGRKPKEGSNEWGRGFVDWATMQKQKSESDLAAAAAAAGDGQQGGGDEGQEGAALTGAGAGAAFGVQGRHHPAAVVPGHRKYAAHQQHEPLPQQQHSGANGTGVKGARQQGAALAGSGAAEHNKAAVAAGAGHTSHPYEGAVVVRTVARKQNGRTAMGRTNSPNARQQQQEEPAAARPSSRFANTMMGRALQQHQKELEGLLKGGSDAAGASSKPSAPLKAETTAADDDVWQPQQQRQQLGYSQQDLLSKPGLQHRPHQQSGPGTAGDSDVHAGNIPVAVSPHPLVHAVGGEGLRPDPLGPGLLGHLGGIYPALFGGLSAGTPPLAAVDRPPSRPLSAAALVAAAAALRPPSRAASRQAAPAATTDSLGVFSGLDPALAAALHLHDARPPTPLGLSEYAALFRAATPDALGGSQLAAALTDLQGGSSWLTARTPPLADLLQGIGAVGGSAATAAGPGAATAGAPGMGQAASQAVSGSSIARPRSAGQSALVAAAAAAVAMGMADGAAAAAAGDAGSFFNIDELILPAQSDSNAGAAGATPGQAQAAAAAAAKAEQVAMMSDYQPSLASDTATEAAMANSRGSGDHRPVFGCGLDLLAGAVAAETELLSQQ